MNKNITISNVKNSNEVADFQPVIGEWSLHCDSDDRSAELVKQSIRNYFDVDFKMEVEIYHANGFRINSDTPSEGRFVAIRI